MIFGQDHCHIFDSIARSRPYSLFITMR